MGGYDYGYSYGSDFAEVSEAMGVLGSVYFVVIGLSLLISVAIYVFNSLGLMTIAKNRGISNPWIAWIPFAGTFLLGKVSDDINSRKGKKTSHRKVLLAMEIVGLGCFLLGMVVMIVALVMTTVTGVNSFAFESDYYYSSSTSVAGILLPMLGALAFVLIGLVFLIIYTVFYYIAIYNIFKTYSPNYAVLFLVLSLLVYSSLASIFLFAIRNKAPVDPIPPMGYYPPNGYPSYPNQTYVPNQPYQQNSYQVYTPQQPVQPQQQQWAPQPVQPQQQQWAPQPAQPQQQQWAPQPTQPVQPMPPVQPAQPQPTDPQQNNTPQE